MYKWDKNDTSHIHNANIGHCYNVWNRGQLTSNTATRTYVLIFGKDRKHSVSFLLDIPFLFTPYRVYRPSSRRVSSQTAYPNAKPGVCSTIENATTTLCTVTETFISSITSSLTLTKHSCTIHVTIIETSTTCDPWFGNCVQQPLEFETTTRTISIPVYTTITMTTDNFRSPYAALDLQLVDRSHLFNQKEYVSIS